MSVRRRTLLSTLALALLGMLVLAGPASALHANYSSKLTFNLVNGAFKGRVKSSEEECLQERTVKLFRERNKRRALLATTTSAADGSWSIPTGNRLTVGSYYATLTVKVSTETGVRCLAAKSRVAILD